MPLFVNSSVRSPAGTRLALGTTVATFVEEIDEALPKLDAGSDTIRGSGVTGGVDIGRNGTNRDPRRRPR